MAWHGVLRNWDWGGEERNIIRADSQWDLMHDLSDYVTPIRQLAEFVAGE